ncbi:HAD family hydrolase [Streptomyces sp. NPDC058872]|uniref:HAD family hydrolase n=1 Tax=Streptomyces sp. NPDC058872 TaxID=3346661 RepID=UPI00367DF6D1
MENSKGNLTSGGIPRACELASRIVQRVQLLALFDLDNTLIDRQGALHDWACDFVSARGLPVVAARAITDALDARACPSDFARIKVALGLHDSVDSLWGAYVAGMARRARCQQGVREGLWGMKAGGWAIGIATNGAPDIQHAKLEGAGLAELVDGVCASGEVGTRKPDRAVFEEAARRCGARLEDGGWMVGDNPGIDVEGGRKAGLQTLWISAGRQWPDGVDSPYVTALNALDAVRYLSRRGRSRSTRPSSGHIS